MLLSSNARELRVRVEARWQALDAWLGNPANEAGASKVRKAIDNFRQDWKNVDHGLLTDTSRLLVACNEVEAAERTAMDVGYPQPALMGTCTQGLTDIDPIANTGEVGEEFFKDNADNSVIAAIDRLTTPKDVSACYRAGMPDSVCSKDPKDGLKPWFWWTLAGAGVVMFGGLAYVAAKAAPVALAMYLPPPRRF